MQIHEYEYVTRAEYSPVQKDVEAIIRKAQRIMKEKYDFKRTKDRHLDR